MACGHPRVVLYGKRNRWQKTGPVRGRSDRLGLVFPASKIAVSGNLGRRPATGTPMSHKRVRW